MTTTKRKTRLPKLADTGPDERWQHDDYDEVDSKTAGVRNRRVVPPIEVLYNRGTISNRQYSAATRYQRAWEIGDQGANEMPEELPPGIQAGSREAYSIHRLNALRDYRESVQAMGQRLSRVVELVVIHRATINATAREMRTDKRGIVALLSVALDMLADHYGY